MIQAIFISALSFSAFALGEKRKFTSPAASNNLRGQKSEAIATVEDASVEGILHGALAPLLALKASVPLKITQASFTRLIISPNTFHNFNKQKQKNEYSIFFPV